MRRTEYDHQKKAHIRCFAYAETMYVGDAVWLHHRGSFRELPEGARQWDVRMTILCEQCAEIPLWDIRHHRFSTVTKNLITGLEFAVMRVSGRLIRQIKW